MSNDWPIVCLSDFVSIKHGFAFKGEFFSDTPTKDILVTPGNFAVGGGFKSDKLKYYNGPVPEDYILNPDDLLVTMTDLSKQSDTLGFSALVPSHPSNQYLHNQRVGLVTFKNLGLDKFYLFFLLRSQEYRHHVISSATGSTVKHTSPSRIISFELRLPPLPVQIEIGRALKYLEDKIQLNQQISKTLEKTAEAIFKSWFVDFEPTKAKIAVLDAGGTEEDALLAAMTAISGKNNAELEQFKNVSPEQYEKLKSTAELFPSEMQDSELGGIPKGWSCLSLDGIAHYQNGLALQRYRPESDEDDFLPVVKIAQLRQGYTDGKEKASVNINPACILENGDVVFSWSGSLIVDIWNGGKAALNQHLFRVSSSNFPKWFYYLYTKHHLASFQSIAAAKAVTMGHINRRHLTEALCAVPLDEHLAVFNSTFQSLLDLGSNLVLEAKTLETLRDTLLPRLLSGEIDVSAITD